MRKRIRFPATVLCCFVAPAAWADYKADVGYSALLAELGAAMPTGSGVRVMQVEANSGGTVAAPVYLPDPNNAQFAGKTLNATSGTAASGYSSHATGVGQMFYGNSSSMAPGIGVVDAYEANDWLGAGFLGGDSQPLASSARVANHSWVGSGTAVENAQILARTDWLVQKDEFIQVVAMGNGASNQALLGSAYNGIAVGRTDGNHGQGSVALAGSAVYQAGRTRPDLVAPSAVTSVATPVVASAAALLVGVGHAGGTGLSQGSTTNRNGDTIFNAERSETIKAVLMAGADRETANTSTTADITDYRAAGHQSANGLDTRYGAGQVNIHDSYYILAAGEQDSQQDGGGSVSRNGWDYDPGFGGANGSNAVASYFFDTAGLAGAGFTASLAWNLWVNDSLAQAALPHLNLSLFDTTMDPSSPVASSASSVDNTQNLWLSLFGGHQYELRVTAAAGSAFQWDYALAWQVAPVPLPAGAWLFASGLAGLAGLGRARA